MTFSKQIQKGSTLVRDTVRGIFVTDIHLKTQERYGTIKDGVNSRLSDKLRYLDEAVEWGRSHKVDLFVIGGDVFDRLNPTERLRHTFIKAISPLFECSNMSIINIVGNHDTDMTHFNLMSESEFFQNIKGYFRIVNEPLTLYFKGWTLEFIPWMTDQKAVAEYLNQSDGHLVFGHMEIKGAVASGSEMRWGEGIDPDVFKQFIYTFAGHFHKHQYTDYYCYAGSLARSDFGDRRDRKGFIYFELSPDKLEWKFIDIFDRQFIEMRIAEGEELPKHYQVEGAVVKLVVEGSNEWFIKHKVAMLPAELYGLGAHKVIHQLIRKKEVYQADKAWGTTDFNTMVVDYAIGMKRPELQTLGKELLMEGFTAGDSE